MVATGPMPGSTPISVPEQYADEAVEEILQRQRDTKTELQVGEQFHQNGNT